MTHVLVLCDDYWHPGEVVHEGLNALAKTMPLQEAWQFDYIDDGHAWRAERMAGYDVVVLAKYNHNTQEDQTPWVDEKVAEAFRNWVAGGKGLLVMHSGTAYADIPVMRALIGGVFDHHPPQLDVTNTPVAGHRLTADVTTFTQRDEHYHMIMDDPEVDLFMTSTSDAGEQPGGWTRREGKGKVCVLVPGHNVEVWLDPNYQRLIANCLDWCAEDNL